MSSPKQEIAIKVDDVSKDFVLPHLRKSSIKSVFTGIFDLKKSRNNEVQHALKDISFEVRKGEFFGIVGRNGSGKSTLLKMLAGIYQPTKGKVHVNGKLVPFIELGVGFNPELTGRENIYLNGALLGFDSKKIDSMYDDIVNFAELDKFMDQKLKNYSSGMQVRLAFSMAIRADADILLIDEVLAVGDADFQRKCFRYFEELKRNKKTVVFVSHDMNAVEQYCDRAVLIENSKLIMSDQASVVAKEYTKLFIENTNINKFKSENYNQKNSRRGTKKIVFKNPTIKFSDKLQKEVIIRVTLVASEMIARPKVGFALKNFAGTTLMGTNTDIQRVKIGQIIPGQQVDIFWSMPNIFNEGDYYIDLSVSNEGEVCDWWEDALKLRIIKETRSPYLVSPDIACGIRMNGANK